MSCDQGMRLKVNLGLLSVSRELISLFSSHFIAVGHRQYVPFNLDSAIIMRYTSQLEGEKTRGSAEI